ncbi:PKD domain protein [compost metagenome]
MKGTKFLMLLLCIIVYSVNAQQDNNWYFGRMAGLNFNGGRAVAITNSAMSTMEGSSAISDQNGQLLFYTNGISVWNRDNQLMPHGNGLLGDQSTTQSSVIVPKPGQDKHYYIFAADDAGGPNGLTYSEVDMIADNGKGDVVSFNNQLITPVSEKIVAVQHSNGTDMWVITHHWGSNAFYSYKVTAAGVNPVPVISNAGLVTGGADSAGHYAGWMNISPDGNYLAVANGLLAAELFNFDPVTGMVSNPVTIKSPAKCYGVEFSPNSKLLYLSSNDKIFQYQVNASNVANTAIEIAGIDVASSLKLGPDSKIYVVNKYLSGTMSVINNPDVAGLGCNFVLNGIDLAGKQTFVGLPNFVISPFYVLGIKTNSDCADSVISFSAIVTKDTESVLWDFGDGNMSTDLNAMHTYATSGTYTVKAKAKRGTFIRYYSKVITVYKAPVAITPPNLITCGTEEGEGVFNLHDQDAVIRADQDASAFTVSYYTTLEDAEAGTNPVPYTYTSTVSPQLIYARLSRNTGICYDITSFMLTVAPKPILDMQDSYSFCKESSITISAPKGLDSYLWSTGEKTSSIHISKAGIYTLTVTKATGNTVCETTKTITVQEALQPVIKEIEVKDWTSNNNSITVITESVGDYEYSVNGMDFQESPVFNDLAPGQYTVLVRDKNGCGFAEGKVALLMYPNFFTPNGDNIHDTWRIEYAYFDPGMIVHIYDRYGKHLTSIKGNTSGWDGTFNGNALPSDDYWFVAQLGNGTEHKGHFSMLR